MRNVGTVIALQRPFVGILLLSCLLCGCTRHDSAKEAFREAAEKDERILDRDPTNYDALHELAIYYCGLYTQDTMTGNRAADRDKEKALSLTREALKQAPLTGRVELGMNLERLGYEQEALSVYEDFLKQAQQTSAAVAIPNLATNAPATTQREAEAEWRKLIAAAQSLADSLKKKMAGQPPPS
jgi:tetratricopeptide (TPR) repeat protein